MIRFRRQKLKQQNMKRYRNQVTTFFVLVMLSVGLVGSPRAFANQLEQQINELRQENNQTAQADQLLEYEEQNIQAVITRLQGEISAAESQIKATQAKQAATQVKIDEAEAELQKQRDLLGQNIRAMYVEGDVSTMEMLASSKDLSDYLDKEQYRNSLQAKIKMSLDKVTALKEELSNEKKQLDQLIADQKAIQKQLDSQRGEQSRLLGLNQSQQGEYEQQMASNNTKIAELRRQQIAENARFTRGARANVPDSTGYPWANAPFPNSIPDNWGMYQRQCVSYTAWKVWKSGRYMPYWGGRGNANQWDDNARAAKIPVDNKPRVGDVAVSNAGYYGHVMYVEAVYDDGTIYVSQYNAGWDGEYSEARIPVGNLVFIHF
jgi:surface antigen